MAARDPSWNEVLDTVLTSRLRSVHTAMPGTITAYDADEQTATVELAVHLETTAGAFERVPPLADVPVLHPGAWAAGDRCLLVFAEEDPSKWWDTASVEPPQVLQRHGLHAVCIPMVEGAAQFVALANLVDAKLNQLRDAIASAAQTEAGASGLVGMTALAGALTIPPAPTPPGPTAWPAGSVEAAKVKAV
jgi:hypothetical protein